MFNILLYFSGASNVTRGSRMNFWTSHVLQLITLAMVVVFLFATPVLQRKKLVLVPTDLKLRYLRLCNDVLVQVATNTIIPLVLSLAAVGLGSLGLSEGIATSFLGICVASGASALWNVRKAHVVFEMAKRTSEQGNRVARLNDVYQKNLSAFTAALLSLIFGVAGLLASYANFSVLPDWFWFACFLLSSLAIYSTGWSISVQTVAEAYESNPALGAISIKTPKKSNAARRK